MRGGFLVVGLLVATFFVLILQEFIPPIGLFSGARLNVVPVLFCYGALVVPFPLMLFMAVVTGLMTDLSTLQIIGASAEIGLGWSIIFYLAVGLACQGLRPLVLGGHWELHTLMSALTAILLPALQFAMITLRRLEEGGIVFSDVVTWRILGPGIILLFVSPAFWFAMHWAFGPVRKIQVERDE